MCPCVTQNSHNSSVLCHAIVEMTFIQQQRPTWDEAPVAQCGGATHHQRAATLLQQPQQQQQPQQGNSSSMATAGAE
jgi:hypothetical protein